MGGKSVLIVDADPEVLERYVTGSRDDLENIYFARDSDAAINTIYENNIDILVSDVIRYMGQPTQVSRKMKHSTGVRWEGFKPYLSVLEKVPDLLISNPEEDIEIFNVNDSNDSPNYEGLNLLYELFFNKEVIGEKMPKYLIMTDRKRTDGYTSLRVAHDAIQFGGFEFVPKPSEKKFKEIFERMHFPPYPPLGTTPSLYAFVGPKCVGKSELLSFMCRYLPWFTKVPKYTDRERRKWDKVHLDNFNLEDLISHGLRIEKNIYWTNGKFKCCIPRLFIDQAFREGYDCGVTIANPAGVDSLLEHYPDAKIFSIVSHENMIQKLWERRKADNNDNNDTDVGIKDILATIEKFNIKTQHLIGALGNEQVQGFVNRRFFEVANDLYQIIIKNREKAEQSDDKSRAVQVVL